jgi:uncharacterized membrane protein YcaP (DUF421 family)
MNASIDGLAVELGSALSPELREALLISFRALVAFLAAWLVVRLGSKRFLGKYATFDIILGIIVGSTFSRAINGKAPLIATALAGLVLIGLHWLFSVLTFHFPVIDRLVKGNAQTLVEQGNVQWPAMRANHLDEHDLHEAIRARGKQEDVRQVELAVFERNGEISIIPRRKGEPRVVTIEVAEGVQRVRLEISG